MVNKLKTKQIFQPKKKNPTHNKIYNFRMKKKTINFVIDISLNFICSLIMNYDFSFIHFFVSFIIIIIEFVRFEIQYSRFNVSLSLSLFHVLFSFKLRMGRYRVAYDLIVRLNHG